MKRREQDMIFSYHVTGTQTGQFKGQPCTRIATESGILKALNRREAVKLGISKFRKKWPTHKPQLWEAKAINQGKVK
jgi:hypothetical protein